MPSYTTISCAGDLWTSLTSPHARAHDVALRGHLGARERAALYLVLGTLRVQLLVGIGYETGPHNISLLLCSPEPPIYGERKWSSPFCPEDAGSLRRATNIRPHGREVRGVAVRAPLSCWTFGSRSSVIHVQGTIS